MGKVGIPFSEIEYGLWSQTSQTRLYYLAGDLGPVIYYSCTSASLAAKQQSNSEDSCELTHATYEITTFIHLNDQISASSHDSIKHLKHTT